jgi:hypothetical protein
MRSVKACFLGVLSVLLSSSLGPRSGGAEPEASDPATIREAPERPRPISEDELAKIYGAAIQQFYQTIPEDEAVVLARHVIRCSRSFGLDARLVIAVIEAEGTFDRLRSTKNGLKIGEKAAETVISDLAKDLKGRIRDAAQRGEPTEEAIRKALISRDTSRRHGGKRAREYSQRVVKLYRQICGDEER